MDRPQEPAVSVIIPVYNGTNYLREAIDSVLVQTFTDYEIIVVDDGSTDGTWDIIQSYGHLLRGIQKPNGGVASALNRGLQEMNGRWFAWLSHDDLWLPQKLEQQVGFLLNNPSFKACYTDYYIVNSADSILRSVKTPWYPRQDAIRIMLGQCYINGSSMLIERACFDQVGCFSETLRTTQDVDMWLRLLQYFEIGRISESLTKHRWHPDQDSQQKVTIHRREKTDTFSRIFEDWKFTRIFPEWASVADQPQTQSKAYTWFGDRMSIYQHLYDLADEQYKRAIKVYPSWRNPARIKLLINWGRRFVYPIYIGVRRFLGRIIRSVMGR